MIIGIVVGILILVVAGYFYFSDISCQNYDGNEQKCLSHLECEWDAGENNCDPVGSMEEREKDEGDVDDGMGGEDNPNENEREGFNEELEAIEIPDNLPNTVCKKIPLSDKPPYAYSMRYQCLARVNNDARFCEGVDQENEKNMCLAHANEDSSYCEKVEGQEAKHTCYFILAVSSENIEFCKEINYLETAQENKDEKLKCYYGFISNLYQWDKSDEIKTEYCNEFPSDWNQAKTACLAMKERDVSICGDDPECLTHFEQPLSFCDTRPNFASCIKDRAKINEDVSLCELLPQPDKDVCYGVYCTHIELDTNICDKIENINKRQEFYVELAMTLNNW